MEINFNFFTSSEIYFGRGKIKELPELCKRFGKKIFLLRGKRSFEENETIISIFQELSKNFVIQEFVVLSEPEVEVVEEAVGIARDFKPDIIVSVGGGSVVDTGKAVSGLCTNEGYVIDYLEGVGKGKKIEKPPIPFIAIPTTAGTGSEVTKNAVISSRKLKFKKSIRHEYLIPKIALVDPSLTDKLSPEVTASSGIDALTQLLESFLSINSNPLTEAISLKGLELASKFLLEAYENGNNRKARDAMSLSALLSGMALANAGLGAVHGIAAALGGLFNIPHGVACGILLPSTFEVNLQSIIHKEGKEEKFQKFVTISKILTQSTNETPDEIIRSAIKYLKDLKQKLKLPSLKDLGITESDIPQIVKESRGSSMKTNPVVLSDEEISKIIFSSL